MEPQIELIQNKKYFYVETTRNNAGFDRIDISIFGECEWNHLLNMSKTFEHEVIHVDEYDTNGFSYNETNLHMTPAIYFLYNCEFCKGDGFSNLDYHHGNKDAYYKLISNKLEEYANDNNKKLTINKFRNWIVTNYTCITKYYNMLNN